MTGNTLGKIIIPLFDPEDQQVTPRTWLNMLEMGRQAAGKNEDGSWKWTDEVTCNNAILLLRGKAAQWVENLLETKSPVLKKWEDFKKAFKNRFIKSLTLTEKLNLMDLQMKSTETVLDFYDRCTNNMTLFYEAEWEKLVKDETSTGLPWGSPGTKVTVNHISVSQNYYAKCIEVHLKMAFAAGLKDSIKRQTLIQPSEGLAELLAIAQRVEASQREVQPRVQVAAVVQDEVSDDEQAEAAAVNYRRRVGPQQRPVASSNKGWQQGNKAGRFSGECFYCLKPYHMKKECITRRNDRNKGIFCTNINAPLSNQRQNSSLEAEEEAEAAAAAVMVNNAQIDYLNQYSA